jgi:CRP-like cAMP-binding protein
VTDEAVAPLIGKLRQHSTLSTREERALAKLRPSLTRAAAGSDLVRQGDKPDKSIFLVSGMLARYHTLSGGERQYLALHIAGDLPDLQSLFLGIMDHSLVALSKARIAWFRHDELCRLVENEPRVGFALWRQTLIDAAIFREAITNNGLRKPVTRLAHMFCEQFVRAQTAGIADENSCSFPLTQTQLGQLLAMSLVSVNRALQQLRKDRSVELRDGRLTVLDVNKLKARAEFDPTYLHLELHALPAGARRSQPKARSKSWP